MEHTIIHPYVHIQLFPYPLTHIRDKIKFPIWHPFTEQCGIWIDNKPTKVILGGSTSLAIIGKIPQGSATQAEEEEVFHLVSTF